MVAALFYNPANHSLTEGPYIRRFHYHETVRAAKVALGHDGHIQITGKYIRMETGTTKYNDGSTS